MTEDEVLAASLRPTPPLVKRLWCMAVHMPDWLVAEVRGQVVFACPRCRSVWRDEGGE